MPAGPSQTRYIGLLTHETWIAGRIVEGIRDYAYAHPHWQMVSATFLPAAEQIAREWPLDGLIFNGDRPWLPVVGGLSVPRVNINYQRSVVGCPSVVIDDRQVVDLAVGHFRDRHFEHFAFVGYSDADYSRRRERLLRAALAGDGRRLRVFRRSFARLGNWAGPALARWIAALPKPAAVLLCHDALGLRVIEACRQAGLTIPQDVAILGVDNQLIHCELNRPALSSVIYPGHNIGWAAAALLDRLMDGQPPRREPVRLPSPGIAARTSTDVFHHGDAVIAQALQFIRERADEPIGVDDVLDAVPVSRSVLERRFRRVLGTTPLREIQRAHVQRARQLLRQTALPLPAVAHGSGFRHASHLSRIFKLINGTTPSAFRRRGDPAGDPAPHQTT